MRVTAQRELGRAIASVLRGGTLLAILATGAGFALGLLDGSSGPGPQPVVEGIRAGGPDALIAAGLLVLTLTPPAALGAAAVILYRSNERRSALVAGVVLLLLAGSLAVAALVGPPS
jgi:Protein of unknown function (DUF1634)